MTAEAAWLLCSALLSSLTSSGAGPVPYAAKSINSFGKDVYGSVGASVSQNKSLRGSSLTRADHVKGQIFSPVEWNPLEAKALNPLQLLFDKRKNTKKSAENQTSLRKQPDRSFPSMNHGERTLSAAYFSQRNRINRNSLQLELNNFHHPEYAHCQGRPRSEAPLSKETESNVGHYYGDLNHPNRPGKKNPYHKLTDFLQNISKPYWLTNRLISSPPYDFSVLRNDIDNLEVCLTGCRREHEEIEAYCNSEFVVNGIVHDISVIYKETHLVTLLVNKNGLYKMNRLFLNPDGHFFQVQILVLDVLNCRKLCPDFRLGSRYIVMGHLYHRRRQLPTVLQERVKGRLRPGDGMLWRGNSYMKKFNRRRDQKVQQAAHSKCG